MKWRAFGARNGRWRQYLMICLFAGHVTSANPQDLSQTTERIAWLWDKAALPEWSRGHAAVVIEHIHLTGEDVRRRARLDRPPLLSSTLITPAVHVEVSTVRPPVAIEQSRELILGAMRRAATLSTSGWVQLDMEARPSHREFYRSLVRDIKATLPPTVRLSVTTLAWWCRSGAWLDGLAADEIVPMVFRMGKDANLLRQMWSNTPEKLHPRCRSGAIGQAVQEPLAAEAAKRYGRIYSFDAKHWRL